MARYVSIWFPHLLPDWYVRRHPELKEAAFVLAKKDHGRMVVSAASLAASQAGIHPGMTVADARSYKLSLKVFDDEPDRVPKLLTALGEWCIRFTPVAAVDLPDGLILDSSGCAHLWKGEELYVQDILKRLSGFGYHVQIAMADTIGMAWAAARFAKGTNIIPSGQQREILRAFPPAALRLDTAIVNRLHKLGLTTIKTFADQERKALERRFTKQLLQRLDQAIGTITEHIDPIVPVNPYEERLPCIDPIVNAKGIEIGLQTLLEMLCKRLERENKGVRKAMLNCYRVDAKIQQVSVGTLRPTHSIQHLYKLFSEKIESIEPALGIELFTLDASVVEDCVPRQESLWKTSGRLDTPSVGELLDRIADKIGAENIQRYLPQENYWPELCFKATAALDEMPSTDWRTDMRWPIYYLLKPEAIEVTAPVPDYPPMLFRYKAKLHTMKLADPVDRRERPWWENTGEHRDYYTVEDEQGHRYWLFRLGHYDADKPPGWYIHGFDA